MVADRRVERAPPVRGTAVIGDNPPGGRTVQDESVGAILYA